MKGFPMSIVLVGCSGSVSGGGLYDADAGLESGTTMNRVRVTLLSRRVLLLSIACN